MKLLQEGGTTVNYVNTIYGHGLATSTNGNGHSNGTSRSVDKQDTRTHMW